MIAFRPVMHSVLFFIFAGLLSASTRAATVGFIDDAGSNNLSSYEVSGTIIHNGAGYYELPDPNNRGSVTLTRQLATGGFFDAETDGKVSMTAWVDGISSSRTYLYWVNSATSVGAGTSTTGYGVHVRVRNSDDSPAWLAFVPDKTNFMGRIQTATTGGANGDLLVSSPANAVIDYDDVTNPYSRLEWTIERVAGDNLFSFKMFRGDTPEFLGGTEVTNAAWSYVDTGSSFTEGFLGIGNNDQGGESSGSEINLLRFQVVQEILQAEPSNAIPEPGTALGLMGLGLCCFVSRRRNRKLS